MKTLLQPHRFVPAIFGILFLLTWDADPTTASPQDGAGVWGTTTNTWWDGTTNVVWDNVTPANAVFGTNSGAAGTVSNAVAMSVGNLTFFAAGSGTYSE